MARKMTFSKLRQYLLDCLCTSTYRQLLNNEEFKEKTGLETLGAVSYWARKLGINDREVYKASVEKGIVDPEMDYANWCMSTSRYIIYGNEKRRIEKENEKKMNKLIELGNKLGCQFNKNDTIEFMNMCLLDYLSQDEIDLYLKG